MHVLSKRPFNDAARKYPNDSQAILDTFSVLDKGTFKDPDSLKSVFPSMDNFKYKGKWWVIDIGGNNLRLIAFIEFRDNRMYVKHIVNHPDYDKLCKKYAKEAD